MKWSIVTDSSCDFVAADKLPNEINFAKVPFVIRVDTSEYVDTDSMDVSKMLDHMEAFQEASHTSCPAPNAWYEWFVKADNTIAITISSNLSGSYSSAMAAKDMVADDHPETKIFVLDSKSAGSALTMYVEKAIELIGENKGFDAVIDKLQEFVNRKHTIFALASFENLIKNGRMSRFVGTVAKALGMWGIGIASQEGRIILKEKVRGLKRVTASFIKDMTENGFRSGTVIISHCQNSELAEKLREHILATWSDVKVKILPVRGLCSYYAERKGLIVAY